MTVTVRIPPMLRPATGGRSSLDADGATVAEVLASLHQQHPHLTGKILDADGAVYRHVNIFVDDDDIRFLAGLSSAVSAGSELSIMPAVAGGCAAEALVWRRPRQESNLWPTA